MLDKYIPKKVEVFTLHVHSYIPITHNNRLSVLTIDKNSTFMTPFNILGSLLMFIVKDDITDFIRNQMLSYSSTRWKNFLRNYINGIVSSEECLYHEELYDYIQNPLIDSLSFSLLHNISSNLYDSLVAGIYKRMLAMRSLMFIPITTNIRDRHLAIQDMDKVEFVFDNKSFVKQILDKQTIPNLSNPVLLNSSQYIKGIGLYDTKSNILQVTKEQPVYTITNVFAKDLFHHTINEYIKPTITFVVATYDKTQIEEILKLHSQLLVLLTLNKIQKTDSFDTLAWLTYFYIIFGNTYHTQQDKNEIVVTFAYDTSCIGKILSNYAQQLKYRYFEEAPNNFYEVALIYMYWFMPFIYYPLIMNSIISETDKIKDNISFFMSYMADIQLPTLIQALLISKYSRLIYDSLDTLYQQLDNRWHIVRIDSDKQLFTFELLLRVLLTMQLENVIDRPDLSQLVNIVSSDYVCSASLRNFINEYSTIVHPWSLNNDQEENRFVLEEIEVKNCKIKHAYFVKSDTTTECDKTIDFDFGEYIHKNIAYLDIEKFIEYTQFLMSSKNDIYDKRFTIPAITFNRSYR